MNTRNPIKPNLGDTIKIKKIIRPLIAIFLLVSSGCTWIFQKEVRVYVNEGDYGWYFIFIEKDSTTLPKYVDEDIDMCNKHFVYLKLDNPEKYALQVYNCKEKKSISYKMKKVGKSENPPTKICFQFYYPNPKKFANEVFDMPSFNDKKKYEKYQETSNLLISESFRLLDSLLEKHNLSFK